MASDNTRSVNTSDSPIFHARITPHRSLSRAGFIALMAAVVAVSFVGGVVFLVAGAWPVTGFCGLDALLIYTAFRINYRAARAHEFVTVSADDVEVRRVDHRGNTAEYHFNPFWVRLEREEIGEFGLSRLRLVARDRALLIAQHLGAQEKETFAQALSAALAEAKRGPTRTVFS